jgi:hypothetical protein
VRKLALAACTALLSALAWRKAQRTRAEQRLWSEATDPIGGARS